MKGSMTFVARLRRWLQGAGKAWRTTLGEFSPNGRLKKENAILQASLRRKNLELDALHFVWCSGGCKGGLHRWTPNDITEELVRLAERNTRRLRAWHDSSEFRKRWANMSEKEREAWLEVRRTKLVS